MPMIKYCIGLSINLLSRFPQVEAGSVRSALLLGEVPITIGREVGKNFGRGIMDYFYKII
jgi:hypothetical protein